jgi:hypothetical protein
MDKERVHLLFEDISFSTDYEFLEEGKNVDELRNIAIKRGLTIPSRDLAIFKGRYAMVDVQNRNKCTLPKKEVKKALKTLVGKAIDKDHYRNSTIGFWLDSELDDDEIISYGAFWKSNFPEEFDEIKKRMVSGKMKISFEAWGDREFKEDGSYNLLNIEFAGGALLFDSDPAFPNAEVMELANKDKILEFAKIMDNTIDKSTEKPVEIIKPTDGGEVIEEAKMSFNWDNSTIARMMSEAKCPNCEKTGWHDIQMIDFANNKVKGKCMNCESENLIDLTPTTTVVKKGKKIDKADINKSSDGTNIVKRREEAENMEKTIEVLQKEIDQLNVNLVAKDTEIASLKKELEDSKLKIENSKIELEKVQTEAKAIKDQLDAKLAAEKAAFVKARKDELGEEFSKDLTDEDISNDLKFENAKLKKELAEVKKGAVKPATGGLEAGAKVEPADEAFIKQKSIQSQAFPEEKK